MTTNDHTWTEEKYFSQDSNFHFLPLKSTCSYLRHGCSQSNIQENYGSFSWLLLLCENMWHAAVLGNRLHPLPRIYVMIMINFISDLSTNKIKRWTKGKERLQIFNRTLQNISLSQNKQVCMVDLYGMADSCFKYTLWIMFLITSLGT